MANLAELGLQVKSNIKEANRDLDQFSEKSGKAERGAEGLGRGSARAGGAIAQMLASIERSVLAIEAMMRASMGASVAADKLASSQNRATMATSEAYQVNMRYAASFTPVQAQIANTTTQTERQTAATRAAGAAARQTGADFATMYDAHQLDFVNQYNVATMGVAKTQGRAVTNTKALTQATLNLSRQFADVGVTAAMGMNPLMIAIQQGPQIADAFAMAKTQGLGFKAVIGGITAALAPFLVAIGLVAAGLALVFGGAALAARNLNKDNKDLVSSLGLTAKQMEHLKAKGVNTGVTIGDVFKGTFTYIRDAAAPALKPVGEFFSKMLDLITTATMKTIKAMAGMFTFLFVYIRETFKNLPAVVGDSIIVTVNLIVKAVQGMINLVVAGINKVVDFANEAAKRTGVPVGLGRVGEADLGQINNPFAGTVRGNLQTAANSALAASGNVDKIVDGIGKAIVKASGERITKAAGPPGKEPKVPKGPAAPRDKTDERIAQIEGLMAQALAEELQARIGITKDVTERAKLEKEVLRQQLASKNAQIDLQEASIEDDKGLTELEKMRFNAELEIIKIINDRANSMREQAIDSDTAETLLKQSNAARVAEKENQIDILESQSGLAKYGFQRLEIEMKVLELQQQIERIKLEEVIASDKSTEYEKQIAAARLKVLDIVQKNQRAELRGGFQEAFDRVSGALNTVADAFKNRNWGRLVDGLIESFGQLKLAFAKGGTALGKIGAVAGLAQGVGAAVGGKGGAALAGAGAGASAGASIGAVIGGGTGAAIGAAIGAIVGSIAGFLGKSSANKKAKAEAEQRAREAEADRQLRIVVEARTQEIRILQLSGKDVEALALQRKYELEAMDASNQARQIEIYRLEDEASALEKAAEAAAKAAEEAAKAAELAKARRTLEIAILEASGRSLDALNMKRADELAAMDATLRPLQQALDRVQDARDAEAASAQDYADKIAAAQGMVDAQRSALRDTYQELASVFTSTIQKYEGFVDDLNDIKKDLIFGDKAGISSGARYGAATADFTRTAALAGSGDERGISALGGSINTFLAASKARATTASEYNRDRAAALRAVNAAQEAARTQVDKATAQLDALNKSVSALLDLRATSLDIKAGIDNLNFALSALNGIQMAAANSASTFAADTAAAIAAAFATVNGPAPNTTPNPLPATSEAIPVIPVEPAVSLEPATPYEGGPTFLEDAVNELISEVSQMRNSTESTAKNTGDQHDLLKRVTRGGDAMVTEQAA